MAYTPTGKDKTVRWTRVFVNGYNLSGDARTVSKLQNKFDAVENFGWSDTVKVQVADGRRTIGVEGFQALLDDNSGSYDALVPAGQASSISFLFGGGGEPVAGDPAYFIAGTTFANGSTFESGIAQLTTDIFPRSTQIGNPLGVTLANASVTGTTSTTNHTSHNNGAATSNGAHAILHILSTGFTRSFTVEHSSNDSDWSQIGAFTLDGSAIGYEHITIDGTINQYVRLVSTGATGTAVFVAAFARN